MDASARAAFFDVDETVIRVKSMFDFLRFWLACRGDDGSVYAATMSEIHALAAQGVDRQKSTVPTTVVTPVYRTTSCSMRAETGTPPTAKSQTRSSGLRGTRWHATARLATPSS